jgi:NAD(P)-dependent dehydrogenase (short-subunit alcohol dehydrogenase family)
MHASLAGLRVLVTQSSDFTGPASCEVFAEHGAEVIADPEPLADPPAALRLVQGSGRIDALVANLSPPAPITSVAEVTEDGWREVFAALVDPLPRISAAVLPGMTARRAGKILVVGSAAASCFAGQVFPLCGGRVSR